MREQEIMNTIKEFSKKLPKFSDGRINYSNSDIAPVIIVFIKDKDKILLLKRSNKVRTYQGRWNTVAGYLDELKSIRGKILQEIQEETGISENNISSIHIGKLHKFKDKEINKIWLVYSVLVELKNRPNIKLDWEHTEHKWIKPEELENFDTVPKLDKSLENALK